jgi:hypothetical protein
MICVDPVDLDFGTMDPNTSRTLQITVSNCGGQQLHWSTGGGGLDLDVKAGILDSNQSQPVKVTLNTGSVKLNTGPNTLLVRFNSSDGSSINLIVTVTLKVTLKSREWWAAQAGLGEKTLWDWSQLLIIPLVLVLATIWFNWQLNTTNLGISQQNRANDITIARDNRQNDLKIAANRYQNDLKIAADQRQETELQTYFDRISDLLLNPNVHNRGQQGDAVRILARARTLTILRRLDGARKAIVLRFLYYGGLIKRSDPFPIVNLAGADLSLAELTNTELGGAELPIVNLSSAILSGADLSGAYLPKANLTGAHLDQALLCSTQFIGRPDETSNLSGAILSGAHLSGADLIGVDLSTADLSGANLGTTDQMCSALRPVGTNLIGADLSNANLKGANISNTDFTGVTWKNTTCPDGTNSDTNGSGSCVGH